jgi:hypothetical protein
MAFQKMGNFTFKHVDQTDELGLTADEAKEKFDSRGEELKTALNNAVDALNATADGNSGADNVGATAVEGWPGSSVQAILESAKSDIAGHKAAAAVQAHLAKNIAIEDAGGLFTATHVEGALGELFTSVSDGKSIVAAAITDKGVPTSGSDSFSQMANNIDSIVLGSGNAVEADVLSGKTFSNDSGTGKVGTMPNRGAVNQSLGINGSFTIPQGYHNGAGQVTQSIATKGAATITPGTVNQVIAANQYLTGAQTIAGSANLLASNIKDGVNIFGVVGTLPGVQRTSVTFTGGALPNKRFRRDYYIEEYLTTYARDLSVSLPFVPNFIFTGGFLFAFKYTTDWCFVDDAGIYYKLKVNTEEESVIITQSRLRLPLSDSSIDLYRIPF